jgi:hypothetical protein
MDADKSAVIRRGKRFVDAFLHRGETVIEREEAAHESDVGTLFLTDR